MSKTTGFSIYGNLKLQVSITIPAESLEDALERSKKLCEADFVEILGSYNDGDLKIIGIFSDEE